MNIPMSIIWFMVMLFAGFGVMAYASIFDPMSEEYLRITIEFVCTLFSEWFFFLV
jgi:hypothetical protein